MKKNRGKTEKTPSPIDFSTIFRYNMDLCSRGGSGTLNLQSAIASKKMEDWRLEECTMYVTLEPCQMCSGAIVQSRMTRVVVGCMNPKAGCAGSILNLLQMPQFNHQVELTTGVLEEECSQMMKTFFKELREKRKKNKQ